MGAGKVLGAMLGLAIGLLLGGPWTIVILLIVGVAAGHWYDEQHALPPESSEALADFPLPPPSLQSELVEGASADDILTASLCALFIAVAHADGDVRREEVREVRRYFEQVLHHVPESLQVVRRHLKAFLHHPPDLMEAAGVCQDELPTVERRRLLDALYALALVDGPLQRSEGEALRRVAQGLGLSDAVAQTIAATHLGSADAHYATLGLEPDATDAEVKSAFRRLAAENHPDKVAHLGRKASEEAARRFQEIRDAYDEIRRLRGL